MLTNYLAELWGFSLLIISLALLIHPKSIDRLWQIAEDEMILFLAGAATLVLGIASVLAYNVWGQNWAVIITILGWLMAIKGAVILFLPEKMMKLCAILKSKSSSWISIALLIGVILGCLLIYVGFTM